MPYHDIQPPIAGEQQVVRTNGSDTLIDLYTYLGYMNDNMNLTHGDLSPIYINGVAGEFMNLPVLTAANAAIFNAIAIRFDPIVFPTAGTIQKTITTTNKPGMITATLTATFQTLVVQANVYPSINIMLERQLNNGSWWRILNNDPADWLTTPLSLTPVVGNLYSISTVRYFTEILPNTTYRVTAVAGHYSATGALPTTGQYRVDATGTNILEFNAWGN